MSWLINITFSLTVWSKEITHLYYKHELYKNTSGCTDFDCFYKVN